MSFELGAAGTARLASYFDGIGELLGDKRRRASFATYAMGILSEAERKSAEPMASLATGDPEAIQRMHDHLLHFVGQSEWADAPIRRFAARHALAAMQEREPIRSWIIDDTGFLKQGKHSPGVQRQYTGSAGKTANCQIGVSLSVCTETEHLPVDMQLYLPKSWTDDPGRCAKARIPDTMVYRPKWQMALDMIADAVRDEIPKGVLLTDAGYGNTGDFRAGLRELGFEYSVGVHSSTAVTPLSRLPPERISLKELATRLPKSAFRHVTWRQGSQRALLSRFAMLKVDTGDKDVAYHWLLIEWPEREPEPTHFTLAHMRRKLSCKQLVRITKDRWRTERVYEDLKGELGLDHYEGRSFLGWHHHVTVVLCCYAFVMSERVRHFSPSPRGARAPRSVARAA
jgi:SRSO17 transposase